MIDFTELRRNILKDGKLTAQDVKLLREAFYGDGEMTMEKGDFLFELLNTIKNSELVPEFRKFFCESISKLLLEDKDSPGEISDSEARWLRAKIQGNESGESCTRTLLKDLKKRSIDFLN